MQDKIKIIIDSCSQNSQLIKYIIIALVFFYFMEGWDFRRLIVFGSILIAVICYFNKNKLINPPSIVKEEEAVSKPIQKVISNPIIKMKVPELSTFPDEVNNVVKFISKMSHMCKDESYKRIIIELTKLVKEYARQVRILFKNVKTGNYPHLTYQKVLDIEKEMSVQIQSLHFKVDVDKYNGLSKLIKGVEGEMEKINNRLEEFIDEDYKKNPMLGKGPAISSQDPRPFDQDFGIQQNFMP